MCSSPDAPQILALSLALSFDFPPTHLPDLVQKSTSLHVGGVQDPIRQRTLRNPPHRARPRAHMRVVRAGSVRARACSLARNSRR